MITVPNLPFTPNEFTSPYIVCALTVISMHADIDITFVNRSVGLSLSVCLHVCVYVCGSVNIRWCCL